MPRDTNRSAQADTKSNLGTATSAAPSQAARVTRAQAETYAARHEADALCLLALGRATGDPAWLQRALAEHPEDPRVQLERWNQASTPEEKLAAARALQKAAPDNPLGAYLEASQAFENHDLGAVARMMVDAEAANTFDSYGVDLQLETEAAFRASGLDDFAAQEAAGRDSSSSRLVLSLRQLGDDMGELQHVFVEMGYWDEADFMFDRTLALGEQLQDSGKFLENITGIGLQLKLLASFDPETIVSDDGTRACERLAELKAATEAMHEVDIEKALEASKSLDPAGWAQYREIIRRDGQLAAWRWLSEKK